jgi:alpha-beta hydrolase superfamily lysophospholipase
MARLSQKLQQYRGGCIILMDWTRFSNNPNYPSVIANDYKKISNAVARRLKSLQADGVSPNNIFLYGHSMGARIFIDAAITFGPGQIGEIDGE